MTDSDDTTSGPSVRDQACISKDDLDGWYLLSTRRNPTPPYYDWTGIVHNVDGRDCKNGYTQLVDATLPEWGEFTLTPEQLSTKRRCAHCEKVLANKSADDESETHEDKQAARRQRKEAQLEREKAWIERGEDGAYVCWVNRLIEVCHEANPEARVVNQEQHGYIGVKVGRSYRVMFFTRKSFTGVSVGELGCDEVNAILNSVGLSFTMSKRRSYRVHIQQDCSPAAQAAIETLCRAAVYVASCSSQNSSGPSIREELYEEQNHKCNGCKNTYLLKDLTIDHISPKAQGGSDDRDNLQLLCHSCNSIKGDRPMSYLMERLGQIWTSDDSTTAVSPVYGER